MLFRASAVSQRHVSMMSQGQAVGGTKLATNDPSLILRGVTGLTFGGCENDVVGAGVGSAPLGIRSSTSIHGAVAVKNAANGAEIGTLRFSSNNREKGQLSAQLCLPDGTVLVQILREPMAGSFGYFSDSGVHVYGTKFATITGEKKGSLMYEGGRRGMEYNAPICSQPAIMWCCFSFACFLPTFGIASCFGMYKMGTAYKKFFLRSADGGSCLLQIKPGGAASQSKDPRGSGACNFESLDDQSKLEVLLVMCKIVASEHCEPPPAPSSGAGI